MSLHSKVSQAAEFLRERLEYFPGKFEDIQPCFEEFSKVYDDKIGIRQFKRACLTVAESIVQEESPELYKEDDYLVSQNSVISHIDTVVTHALSLVHK